MREQAGHTLVVDDQKINRVKLVFTLKKLGHTAEMAEDGRKALEMLRKYSFDLVLLDIMMPEMDGYEVLRQMKSDPALQHIPVIVISAIEQMDSVVKCIEMGAEDYLPKTFDPTLLKARVSASLARKRLRDQEMEYLQQVERLTQAAADLDANRFNPDSLDDVASRSDALGQLTRVFQRMARRFYSREQRLQEDNQVKSAFINVITHELRSPFVASALSVELLKRYTNNQMYDQLPEQIQQLDRDLAEGRRLINMIISFAAQVGRNGQETLNRQDTDFGALIQEKVASLTKTVGDRNIALSTNIRPGMPRLYVDRDLIGEAIFQLVHNAIKFNSPGGLVQVECWSTETAAFFRVTDTGAGIVPEKLTAIWAPFAQTADREKRGVAGLGLGLALVKQSVEAHGGKVEASSKPGAGSEFGFQLPFRA